MSVPETQLVIFNVLIMKLIDGEDYKNGKEFGDFILAWLYNINLRTCDHLSAKVIGFIADIY